MAIITPSRNFAGSELNNESNSNILKPELPAINFRDYQKDGVYLFILPSYKVDATGSGVWYKVITLRDNFGIETKERFVELADGPIAYFSNQVRNKFPEYGKWQSVERDGQKRNVYPSFGRTTKRTLFNVALAAELHKGAHVIEVPNYGCANIIDEYHKRPGFDGKLPGLICDHTQAKPVFFHLRKDAKGMPWVVSVDTSQSCRLPDELADSDYLHDLDDACIVPDKALLIEKLRLITPGNIFDACMAGYPGLTVAVRGGAMAEESEQVENAVPSFKAPVFNAPAAAPVVSTAAVAPAAASMTIPKARKAVKATVEETVEAPAEKETVASGGNPMKSVDVSAARAFLNKK